VIRRPASPRGAASRRGALARLAPLALVLAIVGQACGGSSATFDPNGPCVDDHRAAGAYPALESALPAAIDGKAPTSVDSGRSCSAAALSTYASHGVSELEFAGATWDDGGGNGTVVALLTTPTGQPQLQQAWAEEFYLEGARTSTKTENITKSQPDIGGRVGFRIETLNDLSLQTVVVWSPVAGLVNVVIVATRVEPSASRTAHDAQVSAAIAAAVAAVPVGGQPRSTVLPSRP
jgi:hypothetical protein